MNSFQIIQFECFFLLINLFVILIFTIKQKKNITIILTIIAIMQHFLLNWNTILNACLFVFTKG